MTASGAGGPRWTRSLPLPLAPVSLLADLRGAVLLRTRFFRDGDSAFYSLRELAARELGVGRSLLAGVWWRGETRP